MAMRSKVLMAAAAAALLGAAQTSRAQDAIIYYNFEDLAPGAQTGGTTVNNSGTGATDGTLNLGTVAGGTATAVASGVPAPFGPGGQALQLTPAADANQLAQAPHILTGETLAALGITSTTPYTAMAWANFANATGDNMIFGQATGGPNGETLHNGSRNGNLHSGHWADDIGPDQGVNVSSQPGTWHHVAYTNDATGAQSIYFDGNLVAGPGAVGAVGGMPINNLLAIGTANNGGSFNGILDEVKVFNRLLSEAEIEQQMVVPEPTGIAVLAAAAGMGLACRRRRRV